MMNREMRRKMGKANNAGTMGREHEQKILDLIDRSLNRNRLHNFYVGPEMRGMMFRDLKNLPVSIAEQIIEEHFKGQLAKREIDRKESIQCVEDNVKTLIDEFGCYLDESSISELYKLGAIYYDVELSKIPTYFEKIKILMLSKLVTGSETVCVSVDINTRKVSIN